MGSRASLLPTPGPQVSVRIAPVSVYCQQDRVRRTLASVVQGSLLERQPQAYNAASMGSQALPLPTHGPQVSVRIAPVSVYCQQDGVRRTRALVVQGSLLERQPQA